MNKFWFEEIDLEELKQKPTPYLLKLRNECYSQNTDYFYEDEKDRYETFCALQKVVYQLLGTREHYPNKIERKIIRKEKARLQKVGR